jgi:hypothetical protein
MIPQHSMVTVEHPTPKDVVDRARRLMGGIDLDPATTAEINAQHVRAKRFFTKDDDGLKQEWRGNIFLNPPGGVLKWENERWNLKVPAPGKKTAGGGESSSLVWWDYLTAEWQADPTTQAVFIGFTLEILRTSQHLNRWRRTKFPVQRFYRCYPEERLAFKGGQPTHANVIVWLANQYHGPNSLPWFKECFGGLGFCEAGAL